MTKESVTVLSGHISPETAYVVTDYPYGFLRCHKRYWLECTKNGTRLVTQTSNPKKPGLVWNKPKTSTYCRFGGAMFIDGDGHVQWDGLHEYMTGADTVAWMEKFRDGLPEATRATAIEWYALKVAYDARKLQTT